VEGFRKRVRDHRPRSGRRRPIRPVLLRGGISARITVAQSTRRYSGPRGIHVSLLIVDGVIDSSRTCTMLPERPDECFSGTAGHRCERAVFDPAAVECLDVRAESSSVQGKLVNRHRETCCRYTLQTRQEIPGTRSGFMERNDTDDRHCRVFANASRRPCGQPLPPYSVLQPIVAAVGFRPTRQTDSAGKRSGTRSVPFSRPIE